MATLYGDPAFWFVLAYGGLTLRWAYGHSTILAARETSVGNGLDRSTALHFPWG